MPNYGGISGGPSPHDDGGGVPDAGVHGGGDLFNSTISLPRWCQGLVTSVFRTKTPFAAFVRFAIHLQRDCCRVSSSPAFPVPLPFCGVFDRMPSGLSLKRRNLIHFRRAVVLVVLALNFWWSGNRFVDADLLRRVPSSSQKAIVQRIVDFLQVDGPMIPQPVVASGRRFPQLIARLSELSSALTSVGAQGGPYSHVFEGCRQEVKVDNTVAEELVPYRSLQASRLKLVGKSLASGILFHFLMITFPWLSLIQTACCMIVTIRVHRCRSLTIRLIKSYHLHSVGMILAFCFCTRSMYLKSTPCSV